MTKKKVQELVPDSTPSKAYAQIISVSLPKDLLIKLNKFCIADERSKSFVVKKALKEYLNKLES